MQERNQFKENNNNKEKEKSCFFEQTNKICKPLPKTDFNNYKKATQIDRIRDEKGDIKQKMQVLKIFQKTLQFCKF